jgi:hypothetical protein
MKFDALLDDLLKKNVLGKVVGHVASVEWQKQGLPHVHILLFMAHEDKPKTPEIIDKVVCAEIPNERENPRLFKIITKNNIHGPCGEMNPNSPCMRDLPKTCSKMFPKEFRDHTLIQDNAYPEYHLSIDEGLQLQVETLFSSTRELLTFK